MGKNNHHGKKQNDSAKPQQKTNQINGSNQQANTPSYPTLLEAPKLISTCNNLRPIYAAYLNMARQNLYNVLQHISVLVGFDNKCDEEAMKQMKVIHYAKEKPEKRIRIQKELLYAIPVLRQMLSADVDEEKKTITDKDVQGLLENIVSTIFDLRNFYTHYKPYNTPEEFTLQKETEKALFPYIDKAFDSAKRKVEAIWDYSKKDLRFYEGSERMTVTRKGKKKAQKRMKFFFNPQEEDGSALSAVGIAFLICKLLPKQYSTQFLQQIKLFERSPYKKEHPIFGKANEVMYNMFCIDHIRLPKGRMESIADETLLGLDMINELRKCPFELFKVLSEKDQKLFEVESKEIEDESGEKKSAVTQLNLMRRYKDRFPYLALRYIDSQKDILPGMAFQVALGTYRYHFYDKDNCIDGGEPRVRIWQKEINGFGRLPQIEAERKLKYGKKEDGSKGVFIRPFDEVTVDTAETEPYITDRHAGYAITGNRIGIMWHDDKHKDFKNNQYLPELPLPNIQIENGKKIGAKVSIKNLEPICWLSTLDLPGLIFLSLLGGKPDTIIKTKYESIKKLLDYIKGDDFANLYNNEIVAHIEKYDATGLSKEEETLLRKKLKAQLEPILFSKFSLHVNDLPEKITDILIGKTGHDEQTEKNNAEKLFNEWARNKVEKMIESLERRIKGFEKDLEKVGTKANRVGKDNFVDIRPGSLARYLAKDIMMFQPTIADEGKRGMDKLTGLNFQIMQSTIATFEGNRLQGTQTPLWQLFKKANLLAKDINGDKNPQKHPFLNDVMNSTLKDTVDFYKRYQDCKLKYLQGILKEGKFKEVYFLHGDRKRYAPKTVEAARSLAERYLNTLYLPDGLFAEEINKILKEKFKDNKAIQKAIEDPKQKYNTAYLLSVYFDQVHKDCCQPFYYNGDGMFERNYELFNTLASSKNNKVVKWYTVEEINDLTKKESKDMSIAKREIEDYLDNYKVKDETDDTERRATEEEKAKKRRFLISLLNDCKKNEKTIRRYKTEDILLFLMAKKILVGKLKTQKGRTIEQSEFDEFKLSAIPAFKREQKQGEGEKEYKESNDNRDILSKFIDFSVEIVLRDDKGREILDEKGTPIRKNVYQEHLQLKKYGDFYRFLYDTRIGLLLKQLTSDRIKREDIDDELDEYDRNRKEIFAKIHAIEKRIINAHADQLDDSNAGKEGFVNEDGEPYRTNFRSMLSLVESIRLDKRTLTKEGELIVETRNAFSHNKYMEQLKDIADEKGLTLPEVAKLILANLNRFSKELKVVPKE